jgi:hypothetical protein
MSGPPRRSDSSVPAKEVTRVVESLGLRVSKGEVSRICAPG